MVRRVNLTFERSFACHPKAKYWSDINKKSAREVSLKAGIKAWFDCICGHTFNSRVYSISINNTWCPYCSKSPRKLCNNDNCEMCFNKSFASHPKAIYWSARNNLSPRMVFKSSNKAYIFDCDCGHSFKTCIYHITVHNHWCHYCGHIKLCKRSDCESCFNNSFASSPKNQFWMEKNEIQPRRVFLHAAKKYWFKCANGHIFKMSPNVVGNNHWCTKC